MEERNCCILSTPIADFPDLKLVFLWAAEEKKNVVGSENKANKAMHDLSAFPDFECVCYVRAHNMQATYY
jgi:hypothetical protein